MTIHTILLLSILTMYTSCNGQNQKSFENKSEQIFNSITGDTVSEISGEIRCIFQDSKDNLWFASNGEGVYKFDGKTLIQISKKDGLCNNFVWNVQESKDGSIWFKTKDTICYFNGNKFIDVKVDEINTQSNANNYIDNEFLNGYYFKDSLLVKNNLPQNSPIKNDKNKFHNDIYCTFKDSKGNLWFGTCTAGVCKYDGKTYTWLDNKELGAPVRSIFEDKNGTIWIGNNGYGLFSYDGKTLTNFTREKKLENLDFIKTFSSKEGTLARVWTITNDQQGNLWIGTIDAGVWMFDGKNLVNYTTKDGLGSNGIWTIFKDKNDKLWFGTDGAGVYTFNGKTFEKF